MKKILVATAVVIMSFMVTAPSQADSDFFGMIIETVSDISRGGNSSPKESSMEKLKKEIVADSSKKFGKTVSFGSLYERLDVDAKTITITYNGNLDGERVLITMLFVIIDDKHTDFSYSIWLKPEQYKQYTLKKKNFCAYLKGVTSHPNCCAEYLASKKDNVDENKAGQPSVPGAANTQPAPTKSTSEKLAELKKMKDEGLITQTEYDAKKAEILAKM